MGLGRPGLAHFDGSGTASLGRTRRKRPEGDPMTATQPAVETGRPDFPAPHVSPALLARLAGRAFTAAPRPGRDVRAPATGAVFGQVPHATPEDVTAAVAVAREAQRAWAARPVRERAAVLLRFADLVLDRQDEVLDLIQLENGKARRHAFEEVADVAVTSPLLRPGGAPCAQAQAPGGRHAGPDARQGAPPPQGPRRHHRPLELPADPRHQRRPARPRRRQRRAREARQRDAVRPRCGPPSPSTSAGSRPACCRS